VTGARDSVADRATVPNAASDVVQFGARPGWLVTRDAFGTVGTEVYTWERSRRRPVSFANSGP
jgi:hypothetical protein